MKEISENKITSQLTESISQLLVAARQKIVAQVNDTLVQTYSQTDRMIVEDEQNHNDRAEYGKQTIKKLSRALTERFGKGFSRVSLQNMRLLFLKYEKSQSLIGKLTWTHYCDMYLNHYAQEVNDAYDNQPIGIILCTDKGSIEAEYALGGISNQIFASKYVLYMPDKEQLVSQVENVITQWHDTKTKKV